MIWTCLSRAARGELAGRRESSPLGGRDWRVHPPVGRGCRLSNALSRYTGGSVGRDRWAAAAAAVDADAETAPGAAVREAAVAERWRRPPAAAADSTVGRAAMARACASLARRSASSRAVWAVRTLRMTDGMIPGTTSSAANASLTVAQPKRPAMMMRPKRSAESPRARRSAAEERSRGWLHYSKIKNLVALTVVRKH